jgi:hypothetical protein
MCEGTYIVDIGVIYEIPIMLVVNISNNSGL